MNSPYLNFFIFIGDYFCHIETSAQHTDHELILLWQKGDDTAFELLYKKYSVQLLAIAMQKLRSREAAQEIVQEVFLSFYKSKSSLHTVHSVMAYLYVAVKNRILDQYRREITHRKYERFVNMMITESDHSTQQWIETRELESRLRAEIEKLPLQCRNVFKLSREEALPNKKIAARLEISENTVEQHIRKALRLLRAAFFAQKAVD